MSADLITFPRAGVAVVALRGASASLSGVPAASGSIRPIATKRPRPNPRGLPPLPTN